MKTQKQVDDLIKIIETAEDKESVTNQMVAEVLEFINEKNKTLDGKHVVISEEKYEKIKVPDPDIFYYIYEEE